MPQVMEIHSPEKLRNAFKIHENLKEIANCVFNPKVPLDKAVVDPKDVDALVFQLREQIYNLAVLHGD